MWTILWYTTNVPTTDTKYLNTHAFSEKHEKQFRLERILMISVGGVGVGGGG